MAIYKIENGQLIPLERTTYARQGWRERDDLQVLLKAKIEVVSPETLVIAEEFCDWEDSRRRIDLLGLDRSANLVVIELKRTEDGGHMELQAIRYAAMISTLTFEKSVKIYERYLAENEITKDAMESLLEFLDWSEPDEEAFGQEVKIVLAAADFSKELTTSVMWLNEFGLDVRCVRMRPYKTGDQVFLDVQTVIPVPEATDYQIRIREKKSREREARQTGRDITKFDVRVAGMEFAAHTKRLMMFRLISAALESDGTPEDIQNSIPWRKNQLFLVFDDRLSAEQIQDLIGENDLGGEVPRIKRYFCNEGELFYSSGKTYVLSNQWGKRTLDAVESLKRTFPSLKIEVTPTSVAA